MGFIADTVTPKIKEWVTGDKPHTVPVVPLRGVIGQMGAMRSGLTLEKRRRYPRACL